MLKPLTLFHLLVNSSLLITKKILQTPIISRTRKFNDRQKNPSTHEKAKSQSHFPLWHRSISIMSASHPQLARDPIIPLLSLCLHYAPGARNSRSQLSFGLSTPAPTPRVFLFFFDCTRSISEMTNLSLAALAPFEWAVWCARSRSGFWGKILLK